MVHFLQPKKTEKAADLVLEEYTKGLSLDDKYIWSRVASSVLGDSWFIYPGVDMAKAFAGLTLQIASNIEHIQLKHTVYNIAYTSGTTLVRLTQDREVGGSSPSSATCSAARKGLVYPGIVHLIKVPWYHKYHVL